LLGVTHIVILQDVSFILQVNSVETASAGRFIDNRKRLVAGLRQEAAA